ncbi:hypothetical protein LINPERPRIM_LOCUS18576 [Linum perenne]
MGLIQKLESFSRKQCRSLFWRMRASVKRAVKKWGSAQHHSKRFQYDPSSYALNFDDGGGYCRISGAADGGAGGCYCYCYPVQIGKNSVIWVYVVWVESIVSS